MRNFNRQLCSPSYLQSQGGGLDYEELLAQKRRDEARYRQGGATDPYHDTARLNKSTSEGYLNRAGTDLEDLSQLVSVDRVMMSGLTVCVLSCQDCSSP